VLGGDRIAARGVSDFEGLVEQIPGVSITADYGGAASKVISIRGVGGSDDYRPNGSPSVAMHVDNIYQSSNAFLAMPFFDVERVEVLKGPQGTLYGRNSTAGVINLITRNKSDQINGYFTGQYESYDRVKLEGAFGFPIAPGVGLRLAGVVDQGGGFQDGKGAGVLGGVTRFPGAGPIPNPGARKGWGDRDLFAGRATLDAEFSPESHLVVKLFGSSDRGENQMPDSRGGVTNDGFVEPDNDPYTFYSDRYPDRKIDLWGVSASFSQKLTDTMTFDLVGGYQSGKRFVEGEGTGSPLRNFDFDFSDRIRQHSLEARLSDRNGGFVEWVVGGYYLKDKVDFRTDLIATDTLGTTLVSDYHQERESKAAFGQVDLNLTSRLKLSGGLRYTADNASYRGATTDANPLGVSIVPIALPTVPVFFDNDFDEDNLSGRATLSYRPTDTTNVWVSFGKGYKAGGFDGSTIFSAPEALPFKSENVLAYEGGFKFAGRGGLFLNVDGFYYDFDNLQANTTTIVAGTATSANVRTNVAKARIYGVDISAGATLVRSGPHRLTIDGGVTLLNSKILEFDSSNASIVAINLGNDLPASPRFSGNAQVAYSYTADSWSLTGTVDARHKGKEFKRLNNDIGTEVPAYTLLNARIDLKLTRQGIGFFLFGRNLIDKVYYIDRTAAGRLSGSPRIFGAGANLQF
jgi:iron complex outermembrane recepter protein